MQLLNNAIQQLPYSLGELTQLRELVLTGNLDCIRPPVHMHGASGKELVEFLADEGGFVRSEAARQRSSGSGSYAEHSGYSEARRLRAESDHASMSVLREGVSEERTRHQEVSAGYLARHGSDEQQLLQANRENEKEVMSTHGPRRHDSVEQQAMQEEASDAEAAVALYETASPMRDLTDTEAHQEELDDLQLGRSAFVEANRATELTFSEAHAEEAEETAAAVTLTLKREQSEERVLLREEIHDAAILADMEAEKRRDAAELEAALDIEYRKEADEFQAIGENTRSPHHNLIPGIF